MNLETLADATRPAWGLRIWKVELTFDHQFQEGYDGEFLGYLTLSFHSDDEDRKHRRRAEWYVNNHACGMRLEYEGQLVVAGADSAEKLRRELPLLLGDVLTGIETVAPAGDTVVHFASGRQLVCFPVRRTGSIWELTLPGAETVALKLSTAGDSA
jgi:hypothetical protein